MGHIYTIGMNIKVIKHMRISKHGMVVENVNIQKKTFNAKENAMGIVSK